MRRKVRGRGRETAMATLRCKVGEDEEGITLRLAMPTAIATEIALLSYWSVPSSNPNIYWPYFGLRRREERDA